MRRFAVSVVFLSLFALLACGALVAQTPTGSIHGVVRDVSGTLVQGATVALARGAISAGSTVTDTKGEFVFRGIAAGTYVLTARYDGFEARTTVTVLGSQTAELALLLSGTRSEASKAAEQSASTPSPRAARDTVAELGIPSATFAPAPVLARGPSPFNTEAYSRIDDNQWTTVASKPLSTFSTDVDTASYANVRRFLNEGQLPPADAVRIEELVNYFDYGYSMPKPGEPFSVTTALGAAPWNPEHRLALIGLQARRLDLSQTPAKNLVFLVDVSGSMMAPRKLPLVKAALAMLARNLSERDRIAIVVYAGAAGVVLPSTSGGDTSRVLEALGRLEAGGSTNGAAGIRTAYAIARQHFIKGGSNRVVLATDGDFNVGVTSEGELTRLIESERASGVTLSVLGFGMGNLKDSTMEKLADRGNGNYSYIDSLSEARKVLVDEGAATLVTVAKDVKLQVEFNPRVVASYRLIGYENRLLADRDFNDDTKDAGDMGAGHSVTALYELVMAGRETQGRPEVDPLKYQDAPRPSASAESGEAFTVKLRYKEPDGDRSSLLSAVVTTNERPHPALQLASAVAEFGLLLRNSEFKAKASYGEAMKRAADAGGNDRYGHRAELVRLIDAARTIAELQRRR